MKNIKDKYKNYRKSLLNMTDASWKSYFQSRKSILTILIMLFALISLFTNLTFALINVLVMFILLGVILWLLDIDNNRKLSKSQFIIERVAKINRNLDTMFKGLN